MLQGFQDVLPFSLLQGRDPGAWKAECKWFWQPLSGFQLRPLAEDDAALDNVLQLPDVAGPGVRQKGLHRLRGYLLIRLPSFWANFNVNRRASNSISPLRSRSGGNSSGKTFNR